MAKLVTKFRYYKPGGRKKIGWYAKYIALRDGVERCDDSKKYAPVSYNQKQLIAKILRDYPDSAEMLEYDDYKQHPTVGNASEFISRAIEDNTHSAMRQKTYADYIATRPRAEKVGSHGLFSDEDGEIVLSEVAADLNTHEGNVWTMIVSLRREDAERLGYNNARAWQLLLRSHTQELADALRIPLEDLNGTVLFIMNHTTRTFMSSPTPTIRRSDISQKTVWSRCVLHSAIIFFGTTCNIFFVSRQKKGTS